MKTINYIFNVLILLFSVNTYADLGASFAMKCNIQTTDNESIEGWIIGCDYGDCNYSADNRLDPIIFEPRDCEYRSEKCTLDKSKCGCNYQEYSVEPIIPQSQSCDYRFETCTLNNSKFENFELFDNFYNFNHDSNDLYKEDKLYEYDRKAHFAVLENEKKIITSNKLKMIKCHQCVSTGSPAPILELKASELKYLTKPAYSIFNYDTRDFNTIQLISYNDQFKTKQSLQKLLMNLIKLKTDNNFDVDLKPNTIYEILDALEWNELEQLKTKLPEQIFMLFYHVSD